MTSPLAARSEIANAIRVRHIVTAMQSVLAFDAAEIGGAAAETMRERGFDNAPVTRDSKLVGTVAAVDLEGFRSEPVSTVAKAIAADDFIAADSNLRLLMRVFDTTSLLYVLDGREVAGIVTPSDLNKEAARAHFYLVLSAVEYSLSETLRRRFRRQEKILELLPQSRRDGVRDRYERDKAQDIEADLIAEFEFIDLFTAAGRMGGLLDRLQTSRRSFASLGYKAVAVRNDVMHPTRLFLGAERSTTSLADLEERLEDLAAKLAELPGRYWRRRRRDPRMRPELPAPTPEQLATSLGLPNAKSLRSFLRRRHPRRAALKHAPWGPLPSHVVADVHRNFRPRNA